MSLPYKSTYGLRKTITIPASEHVEFRLLSKAHFGSGALSFTHLRPQLCP
jgi:hypothetical protein